MIQMLRYYPLPFPSLLFFTYEAMASDTAAYLIDVPPSGLW